MFYSIMNINNSVCIVNHFMKSFSIVSPLTLWNYYTKLLIMFKMQEMFKDKIAGHFFHQNA